MVAKNDITFFQLILEVLQLQKKYMKHASIIIIMKEFNSSREPKGGLYVCRFVCMQVCRFLCMYVCRFVCMSFCRFVCTCM